MNLPEGPGAIRAPGPYFFQSFSARLSVHDWGVVVQVSIVGFSDGHLLAAS